MQAAAATEQHRLRLARYDCSSGGWWRRAAVRRATGYWQAVVAGGERRAVGEQWAATAERVAASSESWRAVVASRGQRATIERRAAAASSSNRQQAKSSGTQRACRSSRHQRTGRQHTHSFPKIENWDRLCVRGRQLFTRANIYVSDLSDLAAPMRPASGSRALRAPHSPPS